MRIIITDENQIWTPDNPALKSYADVVLVVCLNGKAVTDKYECFISPYKGVGLGQDKVGVKGAKYAALESVANELNDELRYRDDIIFLADNNIESLYPFSVIKSRNKSNSLHLCAVSPFAFESQLRKKEYKEMLSDLSALSSLLYINSSKILSELDSQTNLEEFIKTISQNYETLLPNILYGIQEKQWKKAFFDMYSRSYIELDEGYDMLNKALKNQKIDPSKIEAQRMLCSLGITCYTDYPSDDCEVWESVEALSSRLDGKIICNYLRNLRLQLAEANSIPFESEECPTVGPCAGTCAKCDEEAKYLFDKMKEISVDKRKYPSNILDKWEGLV